MVLQRRNRCGEGFWGCLAEGILGANRIRPRFSTFLGASFDFDPQAGTTTTSGLGLVFSQAFAFAFFTGLFFSGIRPSFDSAASQIFQPLGGENYECVKDVRQSPLFS
jgi:hypothetical protein